MTNTTNHNSCRKTQIRTQNKTTSLYFRASKERTTSDQLYKSVKPKSFTTILTSHTSCRRSQVKSRNHGKTHTFQRRAKYLKHPVITVINKRKKEPNYGQELTIQSKQTTTIKTSRKGCQARWIKIKIITSLGTQEHTVLRSRHLVVTVISVPGFKELEPTTHMSVLYNHYEARCNLPDYRRS